MKKIVIVLAVLILSSSATAGSDINSEIYFNKKNKINQNTKFVVLPFEFTESWAQVPSQRDMKKNVESKNTEKFELSLLNTGVTVIERQKLDKIMAELALSKTGLTESDSIKVGRLISADIIVLGTIPMWGFYDKTKNGVIEILIKGIVVETGEVAFKASFSSKINVSISDDFRYDMAQLESKIYKMFGEKIKEALEKKQSQSN